MTPRVSATVTMDDLKKYFKGWQYSGLTDSHLEAHSENYDVVINSKSFVFHVSIEAVDDPSDSDEKVTDDPLEFITGFLGKGGGEDLVKHISSPVSLSQALRILASKIELQECDPRQAALAIRHAILATNAAFLTSSMHTFLRYASREDLEREELDDLMRGLKKKGWKVQESTTENGMPELTVDISGIYTAKISVDSIAWRYEFSVRDFPESKHEGVTDDPIQRFRQFYKDPKVQESKQRRKENRSGPQVPDLDKTVAPKRADKSQDATVPPPKRQPEVQPAAE